MKHVTFEKAMLHEIKFHLIGHLSDIHYFLVESLDILSEGLPWDCRTTLRTLTDFDWDLDVVKRAEKSSINWCQDEKEFMFNP